MQVVELVAGANKDLWTSSTKSLRIGGGVTSIRLENFFWQILDDIGEQVNLPLPQLISRLHQESLIAGYNLSNFTSFLRVCCGHYLRLGKPALD